MYIGVPFWPRVEGTCFKHVCGTPKVKVEGLACLQPNLGMEKYSLVMLDSNMGLCPCIKTYISWGYF